MEAQRTAEWFMALGLTACRRRGKPLDECERNALKRCERIIKIAATTPDEFHVELAHFLVESSK